VGHEEEEEVVALLLPDPITQQPKPTRPSRRAYRSTDRPRPPAIAPPARLTPPCRRLGAGGRMRDASPPRWARMGGPRPLYLPSFFPPSSHRFRR
jgi:hypothetical protein